eukprot:TRINITY_DN1412_c0_g1_i1.p1 TRINITY_DN1412_c0_g1~~TRINITY_DN1412_c0_g1_i1.p1  ORF type:complete len:746 (+),score=122.88 TRINITY_DN1412_c0_g1_i1:107-2344(+)
MKLVRLICCAASQTTLDDETMIGNEQLIAAAKQGDVKELTRQLESGVDADCRSRATQICPIHAATLSGKHEAVAILLDHGANIHAKNRDGCTPLVLACSFGFSDLACKLLSRGADITDKHSTGEPLLVLAYLADYREIVRILLEYGANVNEKTHDIGWLLLDAVHHGRLTYIELFLRHGANVDVLDKDGWMALQIAVQKQRFDIAKVLEDNGANFPEEKTRIAKLDGYDVLSVLGKGAFGKVFKVNDPNTNTHYAIKQIVCQDEEQLNDALSEVEMLKAAKHPGVVQYHKSYTVECEGDQYFCVVMELCSFGTLQTYILSGKSRYDDSTLLPIIQQLCEALEYLHAKGIFHRDLKPANIFFTKSGALKIGDFGLAKNFKLVGDSSSCSVRQTQATGTPYYMSPEVFKGKVAQSGKVDIWGVGVTVLEMCGVPLKRPHEPVSNLGVEIALDEEAEQSRIRLGLEIKGYSEFVGSLVANMLALNPEDRLSGSGVLHKILSATMEDDFREQRMRRACEMFLDAAENGDIDVVRDYLAAGADPNLRCNKDRSSINALYVAARAGNEEVVELLLKHEARCGDKINFGGHDETPLMIAAKLCHTEVVRTMLRDRKERTDDTTLESAALLVTAEEGHIEILRLLLTHGADVDHKAPFGTTALMMASAEGHADACEVLLDHGAQIDAKNQKGSTALMIAANGGYEEVVEILLKKEATIDVVNNDGHTAIILALKKNHFEITNQLSNKLYMSDR